MGEQLRNHVLVGHFLSDFHKVRLGEVFRMCSLIEPVRKPQTDDATPVYPLLRWSAMAGASIQSCEETPTTTISVTGQRDQTCRFAAGRDQGDSEIHGAGLLCQLLFLLEFLGLAWIATCARRSSSLSAPSQTVRVMTSDSWNAVLSSRRQMTGPS